MPGRRIVQIEGTARPTKATRALIAASRRPGPVSFEKRPPSIDARPLGEALAELGVPPEAARRLEGKLEAIEGVRLLLEQLLLKHTDRAGNVDTKGMAVDFVAAMEGNQRP